MWQCRTQQNVENVKAVEKIAAFNTDLKIARICKIFLDGCYSVSAV